MTTIRPLPPAAPTPAVPTAAIALLALVLGGCASGSVLDASRAHARVGNWEMAFAELDAAREGMLASGQAIDEEFEAAHREARFSFLLVRGRKLIFLEREPEAQVVLAAARELDPDNPVIEALLERTRHKLAVRAVERGDKSRAEGDHAAAIAHYAEAETHVPGFAAALEGQLAVKDAVDRLHTRAQHEFLEAVRKLPQFRYVEVHWHAANALANHPQRADAAVLRERSQREIARRTLERAKERQAQSQFGAALSEYRAARALDPSLDGVDVAIEHMQKELAAAALIDEARMDIRCDRFDQARKRLASAFELSILARADIAELIQMTARREGERAYQLARDLEIQGKKAEALAAYESLGKDWPNGLLDELVRIEGLRGDIANATSEWTAAEAAEAGGDVAAAIEHYAASERYYPGWKDGKARIERLRAKLPAPAEGEGAPREGAAR